MSLGKIQAQAVVGGFRALMGALPLDSLEHVEGGHGHSSWRISSGPDRFLLRIAVRHPTLAEVLNEVEATRLVRAAGVPAPEVVAVSTDLERFGAGFFVQRWVEGESAAVVVPALGPAALAAVGEQVGELLARLHSVKGVAFGQRFDATPHDSWASACIERLTKVRARHAASPHLFGADAERIAARCLALAERLAPGVTPALTHRDLYLPNLVVRGEAVAAFLDYEHACFHDPLWDFVKLYWWVFRQAPALGPAVLRGYRAVRGWPEHGDERVFLAQGIELLDAVHFFSERMPVPDMARDARQLLQRWLRAPDGAWYLESEGERPP